MKIFMVKNKNMMSFWETVGLVREASWLNRLYRLGRLLSLLKIVAFFNLIVFLFLTLNVQAAEKQVKIILPSQIEISGEEVFLRDVARIQGADSQSLTSLAGISLGRAPRSGHARWLYRSYVEYVLHRSGWKSGTYTLKMPAKVKLLGASQKIPRNRVLKVIEDFLRKQAKDSWEEFWLEPVNVPEEINIPPGEFRVVVEGVKEEYAPGLLLLRLKILLNEKEHKTVPVTVRLHIKAKVLIVQKNLERLQVLSEGDFARELQEISNVEELLSLAEPEKYRLTRPLWPGDVLKRRDIELVPEVIKGAKVSISVISGSLRLSLVGIAIEDGWNGDTIRIKNIDSNQVIMAKVIGPGQVEVNAK